MRTTLPRAAGIAIACSALALAACGSDSDSDSSASSTAASSDTASPSTSEARPTTEAPSTSEAPATTEAPSTSEATATTEAPSTSEVTATTTPNADDSETTEPAGDDDEEIVDVDILGGEFYFDTGGVTELPAGTVRAVFDLEPDSEWDHTAMWVRVKEGHTVDEVLAAAAADFTGRTAEPMLDFYGGSNAIGPGQTHTSYLQLDPGTYLLADFIPAQDGTLQPHSAKGMYQEITVTEPARKLATIESEGTIEMVDMTYELPDGFDGNGVYEITNSDDVLHEMGMVKLNEGKTGADVVSFFDFSQGPPSGPPPHTAVGGMAALSPRKSAYMNFDLEPGNYALISFITDDSFQQQLQQGMIVEFTIG